MLRVIEHFEASDTGLQRRENEDNFYARAPLFVVADGMGGAQAGEVASRIAAETFAAGLPDAGSSEQRLETRVLEANREIHELSRADRARAGMGTTLTAAYLDGDELAVAHVGDSRAYLWREGELTRLTRDHSLVDELVRRGKLTEEEAADHPQRSIITRALGPEPDVEVDTRTHRVQAGDVFLLCSDGLTAMVPETEIAVLLRDATSLAAAGRALIEAANAAGGRDNITVLLFRLGDGAAAGAAAADGSGEQPTRAQEAVTPPTGNLATAVASPPATAVQSATAPRASGRRSARDEAPRLSRRERKRAEKEGKPPLPLKVKIAAATTATLIVLALIAMTGYLAMQAVFFVGTNKQGMVSVFRGLPWELPGGIQLYQTYYISGVPASEVTSSRRKALLNHQLRSQKDASNLMDQLELGKLAP